MVEPRYLTTLSDTDRLAAQLAHAAKHLKPSLPMMLALCGPLGAGKTQLVRSLATHLGIAAEQVTSPTYVLMQRYRGDIEVIHLDYYRLKSDAECWDLGLDEWLLEPALVVIEWADKFPQTWPPQWVKCQLQLVDSVLPQRQALLSAQGPRGQAWLDHLS